MCIMEKYQNMKAFIGSALEYSRHHTEKTSSSLQRHLQVKNSIHVFRISSGGIMSCKYIQLWITCRLLLVLMWMSLFINCSRNIIWYFLQHMTSCVLSLKEYEFIWTLFMCILFLMSGITLKLLVGIMLYSRSCFCSLSCLFDAWCLN